MRRPRIEKAEIAWLGLFAYVVIADGYLMRSSNDTMSIQFGKWLQDPKSRKVCIAITGLIVSHLYWIIPLPGQKILRRVSTKNIGNTQIITKEYEIT